jgi:hypothetical protein
VVAGAKSPSSTRLSTSPTSATCESARVTGVSVDSAWLKHCARRRFTGRQVNIVAGRATLLSGKTKLYAYVGKQVPDARPVWITSCYNRV